MKRERIGASDTDRTGARRDRKAPKGKQGAAHAQRTQQQQREAALAQRLRIAREAEERRRGATP
jgi:hypothetical protein